MCGQVEPPPSVPASCGAGAAPELLTDLQVQEFITSGVLVRAFRNIRTYGTANACQCPSWSVLTHLRREKSVTAPSVGTVLYMQVVPADFLDSGLLHRRVIERLDDGRNVRPPRWPPSALPLVASRSSKRVSAISSGGGRGHRPPPGLRTCGGARRACSARHSAERPNADRTCHSRSQARPREISACCRRSGGPTLQGFQSCRCGGGVGWGCGGETRVREGSRRAAEGPCHRAGRPSGGPLTCLPNMPAADLLQAVPLLHRSGRSCARVTNRRWLLAVAKCFSSDQLLQLPMAHQALSCVDSPSSRALCLTS